MISECRNTFSAYNKKNIHADGYYLLKLQCDKSPKRDMELITAAFVVLIRPLNF